MKMRRKLALKFFLLIFLSIARSEAVKDSDERTISQQLASNTQEDKAILRGVAMKQQQTGNNLEPKYPNQQDFAGFIDNLQDESSVYYYNTDEDSLAELYNSEAVDEDEDESIETTSQPDYPQYEYEGMSQNSTSVIDQNEPDLEIDDDTDIQNQDYYGDDDDDNEQSFNQTDLPDFNLQPIKDHLKGIKNTIRKIGKSNLEMKLFLDKIVPGGDGDDQAWFDILVDDLQNTLNQSYHAELQIQTTLNLLNQFKIENLNETYRNEVRNLYTAVQSQQDFLQLQVQSLSALSRKIAFMRTDESTDDDEEKKKSSYENSLNIPPDEVDETDGDNEKNSSTQSTVVDPTELSTVAISYPLPPNPSVKIFEEKYTTDLPKYQQNFTIFINNSQDESSVYYYNTDEDSLTELYNSEAVDEDEDESIETTSQPDYPQYEYEGMSQNSTSVIDQSEPDLEIDDDTEIPYPDYYGDDDDDDDEEQSFNQTDLPDFNLQLIKDQLKELDNAVKEIGKSNSEMELFLDDIIRGGEGDVQEAYDILADEMENSLDKCDEAMSQIQMLMESLNKFKFGSLNDTLRNEVTNLYTSIQSQQDLLQLQVQALSALSKKIAFMRTGERSENDDDEKSSYDNSDDGADATKVATNLNESEYGSDQVATGNADGDDDIAGGDEDDDDDDSVDDPQYYVVPGEEAIDDDSLEENYEGIYSDREDDEEDEGEIIYPTDEYVGDEETAKDWENENATTGDLYHENNEFSKESASEEIDESFGLKVGDSIVENDNMGSYDIEDWKYKGSSLSDEAIYLQNSEFDLSEYTLEATTYSNEQNNVDSKYTYDADENKAEMLEDENRYFDYSFLYVGISIFAFAFVIVITVLLIRHRRRTGGFVIRGKVPYDVIGNDPLEWYQREYGTKLPGSVYNIDV